MNLIQQGNSSEVNWAVLVDNQIRSTGSARLHCADETIVSHTVAWSENAGFHKARRSCLKRRLRVCWLCIPQQIAVVLSVPDQFASFVFLLILHSASCCSLCIVQTLESGTCKRRGCTSMKSKLAELVQRKALKKGERVPSVVEFYTPSAA